MNGSIKDLAFREWASRLDFSKDGWTPAQLEAFMDGYATFMEGYNDTTEEEAEPQST